ncbi:c-type cytochrome [Ramlibacter sp.]|uniref:c-type cytochrome n=1 Tax=Ramlibacter sp. TaxID=1917967 RepID=UPI00261B0D52|nr:c-type cytochrome [Ramlibacter sp.]MDB5953696.1 c-type cytochrome [Ramlibacter sp.]
MFRSSRSLRPARLWMTAAVFLLAFAAARPALAGNRGPDAAQQTPAALYHNYCSVCHGDAGDGNSRASASLKPPPRDFTSPQSAQELTRERMLAAVGNGVPGSAMVGWHTQLSDEQVGQVVDYVRGTFMRPSVNDDSRGRQIYARVCSVCHGDGGTGSMWASANLKPAPRDFSSPQAKLELTRERMLAAVAAGRPGTAMQGYASRLSGEDMAAVVDYIRGAIMRSDGIQGIPGSHARDLPAHAAAAPAPQLAAAVPASPRAPAAAPATQADVSLPLPAGLRGDAAAGHKFYDANCATCHGLKGDGHGPRAYFINPKPRVFTSDASRAMLNRPVIFAATSAGRRGSEMPAWDKVLSPQEIANVSEYVFRAFIQPGASDVARNRQ